MRNLLILSFMIVLALGGRAEAVNVLQNGDFSVDGDETGWLQFEDNGGTWSVANGVGTLGSKAGGSCGLMWYQVLNVPVGADATISADWAADMKADGFWVEIMFMTFEDAWAADTVNAKGDGFFENKMQAAFSAPWTIQTLASRVATGNLGTFDSYGNDGVGGMVYKKDGWGMNITPGVFNWAEQDVALSPLVPPTSNWPTKPKQDWHASDTVTSMGDVVVILKLGAGARSAMAGEFREVHFDNVAIDVALSDLLPGDANMDGIVDNNDAGIVAGHWLGTGGWGEGDFNQDGMVNDQDITILAANWQTTAASGSVPEPSTLVILIGGMLALISLRRRGH